MTRQWRVLSSALLVLVLAVAGFYAVQGTARAATGTLGTLSFQPSSGSDLDAFSVTTVSAGATKGCPSGFGYVQGLITGPGGWTEAKSIYAFNATNVGVSTTDDFSVPLANSMKVIAANNGIDLVAGTYTITVTCRNTLGTTKSGTFVGSITFSNPTAWTADGTAGPTSTPTAPVGSPTASPSSSGTASPSSSPTGSPSASPSASASPTTSPTSSATASSVPLLGTLSFLPATGTDVTGIEVGTVSSGTTKGCPGPAGNTYVVGYLVGPGGWTEAKQIVGVSSNKATVSDTADFSVPMANAFLTIANNAGITVVAGRYDLTLTCQNALGTSKYGRFLGSLWFTDATHYQSTDPATSQSQTQITVDISPKYRADVGATVTLAAVVTPSTAVGTVQFRESINNAFTPIGAAATLVDGKANLNVSSLPFGLHTVSAVFTPTDTQKFTTVTSADVPYVLAKIIPPLPPDKATLSGTAKVGSTLTCAGAFQNATSTAFAWLRNGSAIDAATSSSYTLAAADKGTSIRCRILATNDGGTTQRTSTAAKVT